MDKLFVVLLAVVGMLLVNFLLSWPVMLLWNGCLVDAVPGVTEITWLQGWGISILCGILFKDTAISFKQ
jgi:hypothetical protein